MTSDAIPQTRTVMEAGFTLRVGIEEKVWQATEAAIPTVAEQSDFVGHGTECDTTVGIRFVAGRHRMDAMARRARKGTWTST